uniref:hypothetical protein n=1 Tax=Vibrio rumoiensis TaxID=76258 RepID=UPI003AA8FE08
GVAGSSPVHSATYFEKPDSKESGFFSSVENIDQGSSLIHQPLFFFINGLAHINGNSVIAVV